MGSEPGRSLDDARRLLANCILFRGLVSDERDAIVACARMRHFAPGETIFLMGSPGTSMMAVLDGTVRISVPSPEGREIVLAILQAGEVFGEIALLDGGERTADARALTACDLAMLDRHDVMEFLERRPDAWPRIVKILNGCASSAQRERASINVCANGNAPAWCASRDHQLLSSMQLGSSESQAIQNRSLL